MVDKKNKNIVKHKRGSHVIPIDTGQQINSERIYMDGKGQAYQCLICGFGARKFVNDEGKIAYTGVHRSPLVLTKFSQPYLHVNIIALTA